VQEGGRAAAFVGGTSHLVRLCRRHSRACAWSNWLQLGFHRCPRLTQLSMSGGRRLSGAATPAPAIGFRAALVADVRRLALPPSHVPDGSPPGSPPDRSDSQQGWGGSQQAAGTSQTHASSGTQPCSGSQPGVLSSCGAGCAGGSDAEPCLESSQPPVGSLPRVRRLRHRSQSHAASGHSVMLLFCPPGGSLPCLFASLDPACPHPPAPHPPTHSTPPARTGPALLHHPLQRRLVRGGRCAGKGRRARVRDGGAARRRRLLCLAGAPQGRAGL
jgi:hypothetical protein